MLAKGMMTASAISVICLLVGEPSDAQVQKPRSVEKPKVAGKTSSFPSDAASFKGHAYKFFAEELTWKAAQSKCASLGGNLVFIDSADENKFVASLVANAGWEDTWIGITDQGQEGVWRTVAGDPLSYTNWYSGQPNNKAAEEHYALMTDHPHAASGKRMGWTWCDQPNKSKDHRPGYVCEWDATPKVSTASGSSARAVPSASAPGKQSYVIVWDFDVAQGQETSSGELLVAVPPEEPYLKPRWTLVGTHSHRVVHAEGAHLLAVRPAGRRFQLKVAIEPVLTEVPKLKTSAPVPANALATLRDNAAFARKNPQTARLARELKTDDPLKTVENIRQWLKKNMTYRYAPALVAAQARPVGGIDSIIKAKRTDCGGYASLFVCLSRQCGVPARLIWGAYKIAGEEPPPKNSGLPANHSELGDFNHHSWAEVYVAGWGWVPLEPQDAETPLGRVPDQRSYVPLLRLEAEYYRMTNEVDIAAWNVAAMDDYPTLEVQSSREQSESTLKPSRPKPSSMGIPKKPETPTKKK
jgi:transglutaminase-like putative cysteine protease